MADGFVTESTEFIEKLVFSDDRLKTMDEVFNKKSDQKDERHHFFRLLTLQARYGFSGKKDAKALAAEVDAAKRMNGSKKEGWIKYSERVQNLLLRQQMIDFKSTTAPNRKKTIAELKALLEPKLTDELIAPEQNEQKENRYPSSLEKALNSQKLLKKKWDEINARKTADNNLNNHFEAAAGAEFLCVQKMNDEQTASFLDLMASESTKMRDNVTLLPFFKQDLESNRTVFGSRAIHHRIICRDMELLGKNSALLQKDEHFLQVWAAKLDRVTDQNALYSDEARSKYLVKAKKWMDQYVKGGAPSLQALILYNYLADQERQGKYDKEVFREYLNVAKSASYNQSIVEAKKWKSLARFDYTIGTASLAAIGDDEQLVYRYFRKLLQKKDEQAKKWVDCADADYVKAVLCEARLMSDASGKNSDLKKLYTKVRGKYAVQTLQNKVMIEIEPQNQRFYEVTDAVTLKVSVKNVKQLSVNVYAINQKNYYLLHGAEVDVDMHLDGLTANFQLTKDYKEDAFLLRSRTIELKELKEKRGVFLVDILGNGKRARCLIRKGELRVISRQEFRDENKDGALQYVVNVVDGAQNKVVVKSRVTLQGAAYESDEKGHVYIPFASHADVLQAPLVLEDVARGVETATLQFFDYRTENYAAETALYVDRECLSQAQVCPIVVRPSYFLNEQPVSCGNVRDASLLVRAFVGGDAGGGDGDGDENTPSTLVIKKYRVALSDLRETVVHYDVPSELRKLQLTLTGRVWVASQKRFVTLRNESTFEVNSVDDCDALGQCLLLPNEKNYVLRTVGKNAEQLSGVKLLLKLKHRLLKKALELRVQSDKDGEIKLGELPDIEVVEVFPENSQNTYKLLEKQTFTLPKNGVNIPSVINVTHGQDVLIPLISETLAPRCDVYDVNFTKIFENVQFNAGYLKISALPAGSFVAMIRDSQNADVRINVAKGVTIAGHCVGKDRIVELTERKPLQIVSTKGSRGAGYKVKLDGFNHKSTRVHAVSSFGVPPFSAFEFLASPTSLPLLHDFRSYPLQSTPDRHVSSEEHYIFTRRGLNNAADGGNGDQKDAGDDQKEDGKRQRFGNVLPTPSLLVSKWSADVDAANAVSTNLAREASQQPQPQELAPPPKKASQALAPRSIARYGKASRRECDPSNLELLANPSRVALNLEADKNGVVSIPADLIEENHNLVTIVAVDDNNTSVVYERLKSVAKIPYRDTRLLRGLDATTHFSEVRDVRLMRGEESVEFADWPTTTLEEYDDLSDVYEFYYYLADRRNAAGMTRDLQRFEFLMRWTQLSDADKKQAYNAHACNEVNFFLKNKDLQFFNAMVKPTLSNRLQKSFFDLYLLDETDALKRYQRFDLLQTLNVLEQILLASVIGGEFAQNVLKNLKDRVQLKRDLVQEFDALFEEALHAKQFAFDDGQTTEAKDAGAAGAETVLSREYQEARYYGVDYLKQSPSLIAANAFWLDYAQKLIGAKSGAGFLSANFGFAATNLTEALLALSVIALPLRGDHTAPTLEITGADGGPLKWFAPGATVKVTVHGPTMLLVRELASAEFQSSSLAVSTNYFDPADRFQTVDFEKVSKFVSSEQFVRGHMYGCRVVLTNVSSVPYNVELLCQIPTGAVPVNGGFRTKNLTRTLSSYATAKLEYFFYFPAVGEFVHYPAHISRNGQVMGYSLRKCAVKVVDASAVVDTSSWRFISQQAEPKDVLENLKTRADLRRMDLSRLAWRCVDEKFFKELTNILRRKQLFDAKIWRYALLHSAEAETAEYLQRSPQFIGLMRPSLTSAQNAADSPLFVTYDAYQRHAYRHVEFFKRDENILALFNARIHRNSLLLQKEQRFHAVYRAFLVRLLFGSSGIASMAIEDRFSAIFYLIAQDRVQLANQVFASLEAKAARKVSPMLYDYVSLFLTFFEANTEKALQKQDMVHKWLAAKLPTTRRRLWLAALKQLEELQNRTKTLAQFKDAENARAEKAAVPKLNFVIDAAKKEVRVKSKNVKLATLNFYAIDVEELFSNSPFTAGKDALSYVVPTASVPLMITAPDANTHAKDAKDASASAADSTQETKVPFPKTVTEKTNFALEVLADNCNGLRVAKTQYNHSLNVEFSAQRSEIFVSNFSKFPLAQAYVKVYLSTPLNRSGFFLKDGYTDMRGRFQYLATNASIPETADKVAVLVVTGSCGANIYYTDIQK